MRCTITSVSIEDWKMEPETSSSRLISWALTRLPLWATAMEPDSKSTTTGWAFFSSELPVVEYRTCPIAMCPGSRDRISSEKMSATSPISLWKMIPSPSVLAIPALSCPRCCSAYSPRYAMLAASGCPWIPKMPHSSCQPDMPDPLSFQAQGRRESLAPRRPKLRGPDPRQPFDVDVLPADHA